MNLVTRKYAGPIALKKVFEYLQERGEPLPNPLLTVAWTKEDEQGNIKAIAIVQSLPVCEPVKADPGYGGHLRELFDLAKEFIVESGAKRVLAHTSHPAMKGMLKMSGAEVMTDEFFDWRRPEEVITGNTEDMLEASNVRRQ